MTENWKGAIKRLEFFLPIIAVPRSLYLLCLTPFISCMEASRYAVYIALPPASASKILPAEKPRYENAYGKPSTPAPSTAVIV